ncbi:uncharacterized protein LOC128657344 [Bombina bombina]|uniref:uncharacterized protein LOC128657344 n=1 Tax=Bombina bombina TaxID=8345 RepID=UPI00235B126E|nr:uncharacterized protein LOC128657344 [Bombina bombina]
MTCTKPDLSWVIIKLSHYLSEPTEQHLTTAKHMMRYLKCTIDYEFCYRKFSENLKIEAYSDADWASDVNDRRSMTGNCFIQTKNSPLIAWKSKKQPTIALSTCEAEYIALAATTQESLYLIQLLKGMDKGCHY